MCDTISMDAVSLVTGKDRRGKQILRASTVEETETHLIMQLCCSSEVMVDRWFSLTEQNEHMLRFVIAEWLNRFTEHNVWPEDIESCKLTTEGGWFVFTVRSKRRSSNSSSSKDITS